jgi:MFS family permease
MKHQSVATKPTNPTNQPRKANVKLFALLFLTGASVIVIEIIGTRVIGPAFGVSLFVWSSLLAVTLGSLAVGYYAGGVLADKSPSTQLLNLVILAAGVLLAVTPAARYWVLTFTWTLGPRFGALASAVLLFSPVLTALGAVSPIAVRLASDDVNSTGRRVGSFFAVSTAGSVAGAFLTGFWLVPSFDTDVILLWNAGVLAAAGGIPLAVRKHPAIAAVFIPLFAGLVPTPPLPDGFSVIDRAQSMLGIVEVIDDENRNVRFLRVDHSVIGAELLPEYESAFSFVHVIELAAVLRPKARSLLQLGLGTGSVARGFARHGVRVDTVEIDPVVVHFAQKYFRFAPTGNTFVEDARAYLRRIDQKYDIIVHDTFTGGSTPEHLLSSEILMQAQKALNAEGLLVLNFVGCDSGPEAEASMLVARTLRSVFRSVRAFKDHDGDGIGNIVFFASDGPLELELIERTHFRHERREEARRTLIAREVLAASGGSGAVITDDHNPLARMELPIAELHSAAMNKLLPISVWVPH